MVKRRYLTKCIIQTSVFSLFIRGTLATPSKLGVGFLGTTEAGGILIQRFRSVSGLSCQKYRGTPDRAQWRPLLHCSTRVGAH